MPTSLSSSKAVVNVMLNGIGFGATQQIVGRERWERVSQLALWNYLFFRVQKLFMSVLVTFLAPVMDLVLLICLIRLDRVAAWALIPYLMYRLYSLWWAYGLWKMNRTEMPPNKSLRVLYLSSAARAWYL